MIDVTPEYLLNILDKETAIKVMTHLEGMKIYFPKNLIKHDTIIKDFQYMKKQRHVKHEAIKELSYKYEMSESQIRRIVAKKISIF